MRCRQTNLTLYLRILVFSQSIFHGNAKRLHKPTFVAVCNLHVHNGKIISIPYRIVYQSDDIKIFDDSKQNRIVVSMPYLIHSETEAEVVEKVLQNSINFVENGLVKLKKAFVPPKELAKIQHVKGIFPYLLYSIENDKARTYLQTPLPLPEFFPIGQWNRFK